MMGNPNTEGPTRIKEEKTNCKVFKKLDYAMREGTQTAEEMLF